MTDTYTCEDCGGVFNVFNEGWSDEEAQAEAVKNFGVRGDAPGMARVCDDCYKQIMAIVRAERSGRHSNI